MIGQIKSVRSNGFGWIKTQIGIDFFFHQSAFLGDYKTLLRDYALNKKPKVIFDQDEGSDRGPRALNVRIVDESTPSQT